MKIKSNALLQELDSPFYQANEKFCHDFERFIASKQGKVKGKYNAWSFFVEGKITTSKSWDLLYKKATYTGTGNLLFSSKYETLLTLAEWTCRDFETSDASFFVRRRKFSDLLNPLYSKLDNHKSYALKFKGIKSEIHSELLNILNPLFESKELYKISYKKNTLTIELRSDKHHFDIFNQLIQL